MHPLCVDPTWSPCEQVFVSMARWYLFNMPTRESDLWTWETYGQAMDVVHGMEKA